jgi:hypothetical protein
MQRRQHPRVRLQLPARLRWSAPLGQRTEHCKSINASRGGLLLHCAEAHGIGHPLWVTFPFDPEATGAQPETLARVQRSEQQETGWNVALQFERAAFNIHSGNGKRTASEKNGAGKNISLPIRVRPQHVPWYEEAMTTEVAHDRLKFLTNREYKFGEKLLVSFGAKNEAPWSGHLNTLGNGIGGEWEATVTGIEMEAGKEEVVVTVRKTKS